MTLSVRRTIAALAVGAALVSAGCGISRAEQAAVVDGTVITERDLQQTISELNRFEPTPFQQALTPSTTLTYMVQAPVALDLLAEKGVVVSDSVATRIISELGVVNPGEGTVEVVRSLAAQSTAQQSGVWTQEDQAALVAQTQALDIEVNPRYGALEPSTGGIQLSAPDWVKLVDAQ